jgi:hypothetical protein
MITLDPVIGLFLTQEEVAGVLYSWLSSHSLNCVFLRSLPFAIQAYKSGDPIVLGDFEQAWIDISPFGTQAKNSTELAFMNRESLRFRFPKLTDKSIIEGSIGSLATTHPRKQLWLSLAQEIVAMTTSGMWVYNTSTKRVFFDSNHRCSKQAACLQSQGIALRASSGNDLFYPERPTLDAAKSSAEDVP